MPTAMIDLGFDPRQLNEKGETIAHSVMYLKVNVSSGRTAEKFRYRFVDELLGSFSSLADARDHCQNTPLHLAGSARMMRLLVEKYHSDLMALNKHGHNVLIRAIVGVDSEFCTRAIEFLLTLMNQRDLDIDMVDNLGWTALHWAVFVQEDGCVGALLEYGANCHKTNSDGRTPMHLLGYDFHQDGTTKTIEGLDISQIINKDKLPGWKAQKDRARCVGLRYLISRGADATVLDYGGDLPFFPAAASSLVSDTFLMLRAAATKGLFEPSRSQLAVQQRVSQSD